jgi:hypothetical protein
MVWLDGKSESSIWAAQGFVGSCKMIRLYGAHQHIGHSERSEWLEHESQCYTHTSMVCYLLHCPIMSISTGWISSLKWGWTGMFPLHYFPWWFVFELQHRYIVQLQPLIPSVCTIKTSIFFSYGLKLSRIMNMPKSSQVIGRVNVALKTNINPDDWKGDL